MALRVGILTVSDKGSRGERTDTSGEAIREMLASLEATVEQYEVVPDEKEAIVSRLRKWADEEDLALIVTTYPRKCPLNAKPCSESGRHPRHRHRSIRGPSRAVRQTG